MLGPTSPGSVGKRDDSDLHAGREMHAPQWREHAGMLLIAGQNLLARREAQPAQHRVHSVRRRAGERHLSGCCAKRGGVTAASRCRQVQHLLEVRLADAPLGELEVKQFTHGILGRLRYGTGSARVEVGPPLQHAELRAERLRVDALPPSRDSPSQTRPSARCASLRAWPSWTSVDRSTTIVYMAVATDTSRLDGVALEGWRSYLQSHAAIVRELDAELIAQHGMTTRDYEVLLYLAQSEDQKLPMSALSERTMLTRSGITRLVDGLVDEGLIERVSCPSDARVSYARLTRPGYEKLKQAGCTHVASIERLFLTHFTPDELEQLAGLLARLPGATRDGGACAVS